MSGRTLVALWAAVASAVFLLGGGVSSLRAAVAGDGAEGLVLFVLSAVGFAASVFVAGRIVFVAARLQRRARDGRSHWHGSA